MVSPGQRPPIRNLPPQKSSLFEFSNPDAHLYKLGAKRTPSGNKSNQTLGGRCNVIYRKGNLQVIKKNSEMPMNILRPGNRGRYSLFVQSNWSKLMSISIWHTGRWITVDMFQISEVLYNPLDCKFTCRQGARLLKTFKWNLRSYSKFTPRECHGCHPTKWKEALYRFFKW